MDMDDLAELAESGRFIPGIYNYCDRWCERCPITARCLTFAVSHELCADPESSDIHNVAFWRKLTDTMRVAGDLVRKRAEELGVDLESVLSKELAEEKKRTEQARNHECCLMAKRYAEMVEEWFDGGMVEGENAGCAGDVVSSQEAVEVIRWYQQQIYLKLLRAIRSDLEEPGDICEEIPRDSDAQAKIALIGIDRSIAGWAAIRKHVRASDDEILDLMVHLERIRRTVEKVFPDARSLVRPGFEETDLNNS